MIPTRTDPEMRIARRRSWGLVVAVLVLYGLLRARFGSLPQWPEYHDFADTRVWGFVPRAGDVLTNLAILAAGLWAATLHRRVWVTGDERPAYQFVVLGAVLTAFGSAWYHWEPSNARLVWDRLPMAVLATGAVALVLADRVGPAFGRAALWPLGLLAAAGVGLWGVSEALGQGDLWLYLLVRIGAAIGTLALLLTRHSRHGAVVWVWVALACDGLETAAERLDWPIWHATGGLVSGHNLKHVLAGGVIACIAAWLLHRRPHAVRDSTDPREPASRRG